MKTTKTHKYCPRCKTYKVHTDFLSRIRNPLGLSDYCRPCCTDRGRNRTRKLHTRVIEKLGGKCSNPKCRWINEDGSRGCSDKLCLQIDHINGGGKKEINSFKRRMDYLRHVFKDTENMYQALCANCNWIKRFHNKEENQPVP